MTIRFNRKIVEIEGEKWKQMRRKEVKTAIAESPDSDFLKRYRKYYEWKLEKDRFLSIICYQNPEETGPLTPQGEPRTIRDVAARMIIENYDFQSLIECGYTWFDKCRKIESEEFDYANFTIWLREADCQERTESPTGKYHCEDGNHRSLVLGKLLQEGEIEYQPVRAILGKKPKSKKPQDVRF